MKTHPPPRADDPVEVINGIGPKTAGGLAQVGVHRVADLVMHLPRRYEDRSEILEVESAVERNDPVLIHGEVVVRSARRIRRRLHIADGEVADETGCLAIRWFNQPWLVKRLQNQTPAYVYGRVGRSKTGRIQMVNPEIQIVDEDGPVETLVPIYPRLGPLAGKRLRRTLEAALQCLADIGEPLPETIRREFALPPLQTALSELHCPTVSDDPAQRRRQVAALNGRVSPAHRRLAFDELMTVASVVAEFRSRRMEQKAEPIRLSSGFHRRCRDLLPFEPTAAQRRVVGEIVADLARTAPMARLLQGDVGSGKTAVAVMAILAVLDAGRQAAMMAPTELLAEQLHRTISAVLEGTGHTTCLLTGSTPLAQARSAREKLADGRVGIVVGTHALFQQAVSYKDLSLVVIDEQHRFGVAQRQRLLDKGESPHLMVMTATPIPRSLALTLYGDLELSVIDELPPGRSPVRTEIRTPSARARIWRFLKSEIEEGGQAYIVYPLIEASEKLAAAALEAHVAEVREALGGIEVGVLHGRLDRQEREVVADAFRSGEIKVIMATTVIEVGVDVPTASVMVVESAERFGLSQLHQLRGRVGRGSRQSWCILVTSDDPSADAERRLGVMQLTTDGFEIAEADLQHRGPGELVGVRQWGAASFRFADLVRHRDLVVRTLGAARRAAETGELDSIKKALQKLHPVGNRFSVG